MKSRLFPSGRVALVVVNSSLFIPPALAACAPASSLLLDPCRVRVRLQARTATQAGSRLPDPCRVRVRLQAHTATQAGSRLPEFPAALPATLPATLLPGEKIHRFHLARYNLGLV